MQNLKNYTTNERRRHVETICDPCDLKFLKNITQVTLFHLNFHQYPLGCTISEHLDAKFLTFWDNASLEGFIVEKEQTNRSSD